MLQQVKSNNKLNIRQILTTGFVGLTGGVATVIGFQPVSKVGVQLLGGLMGACITGYIEYRRQKKIQSRCEG